MSEEKEQPKNPNGHANAEGTEQLKADVEKAKKDYLYLLAEFDNYRKNAIKERSDLSKYGSEKFIREFLNVFDNFERALQTEVTGESFGAFREGVTMIAGELKNLLQRFGVEELKTEGEPFDPSKHEALSSEPREDLPAGHVARVFQKAYKMHDKLIRPAQVVVASAPAVKN
jgi:molecular chaperone GrpE